MNRIINHNEKLKNGVESIQAVTYDGMRTVYIYFL